MHALKTTILALALASAAPALAQVKKDPPRDDTQAQLQALKEKVAELEGKLEKAPAADPAAQQEEEKELARVAVKTEALEDARDASGLKSLKIGGYIDPTFLYNSNLSRAGFQFVVPVTQLGYGYSSSYFGSANLDISKETDGGTRWKLTLMPHRSTEEVFGGGGIVQEASVSVPLGDQKTRLLAGQLPDWSGYEYLPATQNKVVTHNLLFDFTLPTAYTGAGFEVVRGKWDLKAVIANLNASFQKDGDYVPVVAYRVDYSAGEYWGWGLAGVNGKATNWRDPTGLPASRVDTLEVDAYYTRGAVTFQGQLGAGRQAEASITPDPVTGALRQAQWAGASALAAYKFTPRLEGVVRGDFIYDRKNGGGLLTYSAADDHNGIGPDPLGNPEIGANRYALTVGGSWAFNANTVFKAEYRLDGADLPVFIVHSDGTYQKYNQLFATSVVVSF